ncbi:MAG: hypothetical protein V4722_16520 [Bacteroidota bacterium]
MKKIAVLVAFIFCIHLLNVKSNAQVGIGTNAPNGKSVLDIRSTTKGVLFPKMTTQQRNAITEVPDGLHIFNTDERCLNVFDSVFQIWNCYCDNCKTVVINITTNICKLDFYDAYAKGNPAKNYLINILPGVIVSGCLPGDTALTFSNMPFSAVITINNKGTIAGSGGSGGDGTLELGCSGLSGFASGGRPGGSAIATKAGIPITVKNYGIISGGGGGGGGSGGNPNGVGGGGGGGAGTVIGPGGLPGGRYVSNTFGCFPSRTGVAGSPGTNISGGPGGIGTSGGAMGGNGGDRGQTGQNGTGNLTFGSYGGAAGKAVTGGTGNLVTNISGGQSYGSVD